MSFTLSVRVLIRALGNEWERKRKGGGRQWGDDQRFGAPPL